MANITHCLVLFLPSSGRLPTCLVFLVRLLLAVLKKLLTIFERVGYK